MKKLGRVVGSLAFVVSLACDDEGGLAPADAGGGGGVDVGVNPDAPASSDAGARDAAAGSADAFALDAAESGPDAMWPACGVAQDATLTAKLRLTADDFVRVWFNGQLVAAPDSLWSTPKEYDVPVFLFPGKLNIIAIEARNAWEQNGLDRGIIAELAYTQAGATRYVDTDKTWKVSTMGPEGWTAVGFDDSAWAAPFVIGKTGIPPWGNVVFNTDAEWLWTYDPNLPADQKPQEETIYLRKGFYMDPAGAASSSRPMCR